MFVVLMLVTGGKSYYLMPLLLVAMAAGVGPVLAWVSATGRRMATAAAAFALAVAISAVAALPVLPQSAAVHLAELNTEQVEQMGWPEFVEIVARAWNRIPPEERDRAVILAQSYGETSAIARFGPAEGLPPAYSGHMSFADWGAPPDTATGPVVLVHPAPHRVAGVLTGCAEVARVGDELPFNNELSENIVQLCDGPAQPWSRLWPGLRHLN